MQSEKEDEYGPPIEVIPRLRIERKTHVVVVIGWKQHPHSSKGIHAIVGRKNVLYLAVRLCERNEPPGDPRRDNTVHQGDIAITVGRPSTDPSTDLDHAIELARDPWCVQQRPTRARKLNPRRRDRRSRWETVVATLNR